jgi:type VI secretion system FHA domain protein
MTLTLTITNVEKLENGVSTRLRLDRHGAVIGRSPQADWSLPDPQHFISSTHCEIDYRDGVYVLVDRSTNGVFVNAGQARLAAPHVIRDGDEIAIGHYLVVAKLEGAAALASPAQSAQSGWSGWDSHAGAPAPAAPAVAAADAWGRSESQPAISGVGPMSSHWAAPAANIPEPPSSVWAQAAAPSESASAWSSPVGPPPEQPSAVDVWGKLADGNAVDWSRGGFGAPKAEALAPAPARDPFGLATPMAPTGDAAFAPSPSPTPLVAPPNAADRFAPLRSDPPPASADFAWGPAATPAQASPGWGATVAPGHAPPAPTPVAAPPMATPAPGFAAGPANDATAWPAFLSGAGLSASDIKADPQTAMTAAGALLRRLVGGMVMMLEARARAKAQLGAQATALEFDGNNPLKFARSPERALAQLLAPPERGFMPAERAVEDGFRDLQAHQMATLAAMQGALAATLARFSPQAIRERATMRGLLAKIVPSAREAELWKAYEREFEGVARGSDEAFMDVFAKQFRIAYENAAADLRARR